MAHFTHHPNYLEDTIAAIATAIGEASIAVIRISGKNAVTIGDQCIRKGIVDQKTHTVCYADFIDVSGNTLDKVLCLVMRAPRSFTGEDVVEINCHGGPLLTKKLLNVILSHGARLAFPGEFSLRAFLNGKIDLTQAEAIQKIIGAKNELALYASEKHLEGKLYEKIDLLQKKITKIIAHLEAHIDFPDEDIEAHQYSSEKKDIQEILESIDSLSRTFHEGKIICEGITICLCGKPNVGKSSLMNQLLQKNRAIVSEIPGTTRDLLEEEIRLLDFHIKLMDTAGIRTTEEIIEKEGIKKSFEAIDEADIVLVILDASSPLDAMDQTVLEKTVGKRRIILFNKNDLCFQQQTISTDDPILYVSAKTEEGIERLKKKIQELLWEKAPDKNELIITNIRHKKALESAQNMLQVAFNALNQGLSLEFCCFDLKNALNELGKIIGTHVTEDILDSIFSQFCIGK